MTSAAEILRHRPPFLFVNQFEAVEDGVIAKIPETLWRDCSVIGLDNAPIIMAEMSAQLFGCLCRLDADGPKRPGYLLALRDIILEQVRQPTALKVSRVSTDKFIHRYSAKVMIGSEIVDQFTGDVAMLEKIATGLLECVPTRSSGQAGSGPFWRAETLSESDAICDYGLRFNPEHMIFQGHFPDEPIVPGIVLCDIVYQLIQSNALTGSIGASLRLDQVQFSHPVGPVDGIRIKLRRQENLIFVGILCGKKRIARAKFSWSRDH